MVRHVPWDEMPKHYAPNKKQLQQEEKKQQMMTQEVVVPVERNLMNDLNDIGRRMAFGAVCGGITGGAIATVDVLRDVKAMATDRKVTTQKILRFTAQTCGFFTAYHGIRKSLQLYYPQPLEENLFLASTLTLLPLGLMKSTRPIFPYGVLLVFLDAFNEMTDQYK